MRFLKISAILLLIASGMASCASHCGNKSWRTDRFVQVEKAPQQPLPSV